MYLSIITLGFMSMAGQAVFFREMLAVFRGGELVIGTALLSWLLWTSAGSWIMSVNIRKIKSSDKLFLALMPLYGLAGFIGYSVTGSIAGIAGLVPGEQISYDLQTITAIIAFGPFNILGGMLFVLGAEYLGRASNGGTGRAYTLEAVGSAVAGITVSLILITFLSNHKIALVLTSIGFLTGFYGLITKFSQLRAAIFAIIAVLFFAAVKYDTKISGYNNSGQKLLETIDTKYSRMTVTQNSGQITFYSDSLPLFSYPDPETSEYAVHVPMLASKNPRTVLILGGGPGGLFDEVLRYKSVESITGVELDPEVFILSKKYLTEKWLGDRRVKTVVADGRAFFANTPETFDVIIMNMPPPLSGLTNRYYTREFFRLAASRLNPDGVFSFSVIGADNYYPDDISYYLASLSETLKSSFNSVYALPGIQCRILAGKKKAMFDSLDWETLEMRRMELGIETMFVRDYYLKYVFSPERIHQTQTALDSHKSPSLNSDTRPLGYFLRTVIQGTMDSSKITAFTAKLATAKNLIIFTVLAAVLSLLAGFAPGKNRTKRNILNAVTVLGMTEISLEIIAIIAYQSIYGFLYGRIALLIGVYMAGLAVGCFFGTRIIMRISTDKLKILVYVQVFTALIIVAWAVLLYSATGLTMNTSFTEPFFYLLTAAAGLAGGYQFPVADSVYRDQSGSGEKNIGIIYSVDLAGSAVGALVTASLIAPVLGMYPALIFLTVINIIAATGLFLNKQ
jgi:spermidine synthase